MTDHSPRCTCGSGSPEKQYHRLACPRRRWMEETEVRADQTRQIVEKLRAAEPRSSGFVAAGYRRAIGVVERELSSAASSEEG